jgi:hypothetical protein
MTMEAFVHEQWMKLRERLLAKQLLAAEGASLSLRIPGSDAMWFGHASAAAPRRVPWQAAADGGELHAAAYAARPDVGAIAAGGAQYGRCLADFGGSMPQVFDEQARHIGPMGPAATALPEVARSLRAGGNALLVRGQPVCLGMTAMRLALNAELFEKCAKAYVLASACGGPVRALPWIVRLVANRRLRRDERRAMARLAQGMLPDEAKGY